MKIDLFKSDDWQCVYIDGVKRIENHSISSEDILKILCGDNCGSYQVKWVDQEWIEDLGQFPKNMNEIVLEK